MLRRDGFAVLALVLGTAIPGALGAAEHVPGELLIKYRSSTDTAAKAAVESEQALSPVARFASIGVEWVRLAPGASVEQAVAALSVDPRVEYAEPNLVVRASLIPDDPLFPQQWALRNTGQTGGTFGADLRAPAAWDRRTDSRGVLIALLDTGGDYTHEDLAANIWVNPHEEGGFPDADDDNNGYIDDLHGYDFVLGDGDPMDDGEHGTLMCGVIAAEGDNGLGVAGTSWRGELALVKCLNAVGSGTAAGVIHAIEYSVLIGARVSCNTWTTDTFSQALLDAINAAGAAGQVFVAAAGNGGRNIDVQPSYPASYNSPYILAVTATDARDTLATFSNYGPLAVDTAAPGVDILTTEPGSRYLVRSGTSLAAAHAAATCALVMSVHPAFTNLMVVELMRSSADLKPWLADKVGSGGRLNTAAAVAGPDTLPPAAIVDLGVAHLGSNFIRLRWTAPGDDSLSGQAAQYLIRRSLAPITPANFDSAAVVAGPMPAMAGAIDSVEAAGLEFSTLYHFAIASEDEFGNRSGISNGVAATTLGPPDLAVTPPSIGTALVTGGVRSRTVTLGNPGQGTLEFTIDVPGTAPASPPAPEAAAGPPPAKGEPDLPSRAAHPEGSGGPDAFGYEWSDSDAPGGPAFAWVDITGSGTLNPLIGDEGISSPIAMGMTFPFYGIGFTSVRVTTNGFLTFTASDAPLANVRLPSSLGVPNMIAPFWDDLDLGLEPRIYTHFDGNRFIVSWIGLTRFPSGGPYTFQALLYPSGEIRFQYRGMGAPVNSATIGMQNATRDIGLTVAHNQLYVHDSLAVRIRTLPAWLGVTPASGRIEPGQQMPLAVEFDAAGLGSGFYTRSFVVHSNDPDAPAVPVTARLHVIDAPDLAVAPAALDFGTVSVAATRRLPLTVTNHGVLDLVVYRSTSDRPEISATPARLTVPPDESRTLEVSFAPTVVGPFAGQVTLWTNDPDRPTRTVGVTGSGFMGPRLTADTDSLAVQLLTNAATIRTVRITNTGGAALLYSAAPVMPLSATREAPAAPEGSAAPGAPAAAAPGGEPGLHAAGGPDDFGYTWSDSDEPGGPAFEWIDVRGIGTSLPMTGDEQISAPLPIGFSFPFYGLFFDSVRVCTNGYLTFTSSLASLWNSTLPNAGAAVPENLVAALWDDLWFDGAPRVWVHSDTTRLVVQFQDVPRVGETAVNTFEAVLHSDGRITFQYLSIGTPVRTSHTIGIQNAARDDGLQVACNADYVRSGLAVRIRPPARYLSVLPSTGTLAPGNHVDLNVRFDAYALGGGFYPGAIRLSSNDEVNPVQEVHCALTVVSAPDVGIAPPGLSFGPVFIGYPRTLELRIGNTGSRALGVASIVADDPAYTVTPGSFSVPAHDQRVVEVRFDPLAVRDHPAELTLECDDPDSPLISIPLAGAGVAPPVLQVAPASISTALASTLPPLARMRSIPVVIENAGAGELQWQASAVSYLAARAARHGTEAAAPSERLDREPPKGTAGAAQAPVLESSGGPDGFGYEWEDSDEPGGPPYAWVDVTGSGTRIGFDRDDQNSGPIALPFTFPFYGHTFDSIRVCNNGWLSFTSRDSTYFNVGLPNPGNRVPENLIAPFWDDLDLRFSGAVYHGVDAGRFVVSYVAVPHWIHQGGGTPPGLYTFQVLLGPDGQIDFQYQAMAGLVTSATVGLQNATKDLGLLIVRDAAYVHPALRVRIQRRSLWLAVSADSGTTAPGERDTIEARLDATGLADDDYAGYIQILANDPARPSLQVPVSLHVGVATGTLALEADPDPGSVAGGRIRARLTPPTGCAPDQIVPASVRAHRAVALAPGSAVGIEGCAARLDFDRIPWLLAAPAGANAVVEVMAELAGVTWFVATDTISMLRPEVSLLPGPYEAGGTVTLDWSDAPGAPASHHDLWYSPDSGATWAAVATHLVDPPHLWSVPAAPTERGWLELVARADLDSAWVGSTLIGPFTVFIPGAPAARAGAGPPLRFGLRLAGGNPARGGARLELALPTRGRVDVRVFDVRGALVRRLAATELEPGRHRVMWDGADAAGNPARAGIYFVRASTPGASATTRVALVR